MNARVARKIIGRYNTGVYNYSQWVIASRYLVKMECKYAKQSYYKK